MFVCLTAKDLQMSNIYVQEPPTHGKVLLVTTVGDIDVELWSKEAPKACRNFVQLCMEGYYDGTTFFRVVRNFIVQGGDPTETGHGGESIYGAPFQDEFHSRLRFVRRGLVAMANAGPNDNASQFFFTLAATPELANKHTIFGRVAGDTIYNMIKLGEVVTDNEDRPHNPLKIIRTKVLNNPFHDIVPRSIKTKATTEKGANEIACKATKNFSLLSFGEEAEEDEVEVSKATETLRHKGKSSHDLLNDAKLSSVPAVELPNDGKKRKALEGKSDEEEVTNINENHTETEMSKLDKPSAEEKKKIWSKSGEASEKLKGIVYKSEKPSTTQKPEMKKGPPPLKGKDREDATLKLLEKFQSELNTVKMLPQEDDKEHANEEILEDEAEGDIGLGWMHHKLKFEEKEHKVIDANVQDSERYEISDPRNPMTVRRRHKDKQEHSEKKRKTEKEVK